MAPSITSSEDLHCGEAHSPLGDGEEGGVDNHAAAQRSGPSESPRQSSKVVSFDVDNVSIHEIESVHDMSKEQVQKTWYTKRDDDDYMRIHNDNVDDALGSWTRHQHQALSSLWRQEARDAVFREQREQRQDESTCGGCDPSRLAAVYSEMCTEAQMHAVMVAMKVENEVKEYQIEAPSSSKKSSRKGKRTIGTGDGIMRRTRIKGTVLTKIKSVGNTLNPINKILKRQTVGHIIV